MMIKHSLWLFPLLFVALITPLTPTIDLAIENHFYNQAIGTFPETPLYTWIYHYGPLPGLTLFFVSLILFPLSFFVPHLKRWSRQLLLLILTMAIGSGLITHFILKDHWGRPRPKQVIEFGGQQPFRPYYKPNFFDQPEPSKSFACGHCTTGFYFFALAVIGMRIRNKKLFYAGFITALFWGGLLSYVRMAQGGHFFSDVLFGALVMWLSAYWTDQLLERLYERANKATK